MAKTKLKNFIDGKSAATSSRCIGLEYFSRNPPPDVHVRSAASTLTGFSIAGPNARVLMQRLVRADLGPDPQVLRDRPVRLLASELQPARLAESSQ